MIALNKILLVYIRYLPQICCICPNNTKLKIVFATSERERERVQSRKAIDREISTPLKILIFLPVKKAQIST